MTAAELIAKLQSVAPETEVAIEDDCGQAEVDCVQTDDGKVVICSVYAWQDGETI